MRVEIKSYRDFLRIEENKIMVGLTSKPEKGKPNLELIKELPNTSWHLSHIRIAAGLKSRRKIIKITSNSKDQIFSPVIE